MDYNRPRESNSLSDPGAGPIYRKDHRPMSDPSARSPMNLIITTALKDQLDQIAEHTGVPTVRIVESLLRDDLRMPPLFPGLAAHIRDIATG